ncbi:MAG: hypothetical protein ACYDAG_17805 [Chloroflexota bacterium]
MTRDRRPGPPLVGRVVGAFFGFNWLAWVAIDLAGRRKKAGERHLHADMMGYAGMLLALLAPVLSHRNRFFGRLPHKGWQKGLVGSGVAMDWAALGLTAAGRSAGPVSPVLLFRLGLALLLESPFVFLVLTVPAAVPLLRRLAHR